MIHCFAISSPLSASKMYFTTRVSPNKMAVTVQEIARGSPITLRRIRRARQGKIGNSIKYPVNLNCNKIFFQYQMLDCILLISVLSYGGRAADTWLYEKTLDYITLGEKTSFTDIRPAEEDRRQIGMFTLFRKGA